MIPYLVLEDFYKLFFLSLQSGAQEEIDYSAKLKFSDDEGEDEGDEEETGSKNGILYVKKNTRLNDGDFRFYICFIYKF